MFILIPNIILSTMLPILEFEDDADTVLAAEAWIIRTFLLAQTSHAKF